MKMKRGMIQVFVPFFFLSAGIFSTYLEGRLHEDVLYPPLSRICIFMLPHNFIVFITRRFMKSIQIMLAAFCMMGACALCQAQDRPLPDERPDLWKKVQDSMWIYLVEGNDTIDP